MANVNEITRLLSVKTKALAQALGRCENSQNTVHYKNRHTLKGSSTGHWDVRKRQIKMQNLNFTTT